MIDFFEFSNEMFCLADRRGYFTRVNGAWTKALGWSKEELTNRPYLEFVHPDDRAATEREASSLVSGNDTIRFENRYRCRSGSYRWLAWQATLEPGSGLLVATARDVTEQKLQQEALRVAEDRFRVFMDHSPAIAWAKDEEGRIVYLNRAYEEQFHVRLADWLGKTDFELWPQEIARRFRENDLVVMKSGQPIRVVEETDEGELGRRFWFNAKFIFQDSEGQRYVGGIGVDVTELKEAERALHAEQELLRNLIEVQEQEKRFICHEFHDGLIQYAVGSLMFLEGYQRQHADEGNTQRIDVAINSLRKGVEDGRRVIRGIRPALLDEMGVEVAIDDLLDQFSSSGIQVTSDFDPGIERLPKSVEMTVYRVVQEALSNARKHSGTDRIVVALRRSESGLEIEIRDFGRGFHLPAMRTRGFGLLGMTERVRLLGGECRIESQVGQGTRVFVHLPIPAERPGGQPVA